MPAFTDISVVKIKKPEVGVNGYTGFHPGKVEHLKKGDTLPGWSEGERTYPLECDILYEHDIEIKVRDGARLYTDILRPANVGPDEKVPVLVMWSPYGKEYSSLDMLPVCTWRCGIKSNEISGREKFEGLDPARWCARGYAIAHVDIRGSGNSDGKVYIMGQQMAEDGYDVIEALAKMDWCNGNVGMGGNSFLAISQWHIAALQPPSLKAIAPWEGCGDLFRDQFCRGGIFDLSNMGLINFLIIKGNEGSENFDEMYNRFPLACQYWDEKRADMSKIKVPTYISGSDFSSIHTMGSVRAWNEIQSDVKLIRWTGNQEWFDLYSVRETNEELMDFFDNFLFENKKNDFIQKTPKCRWSLLQFGDRDAIDDVVLDTFPPTNTEYKTFYFSDNGKLAVDKTPSTPQMVSYESRNMEDGVTFTIKFEQDCRLVGIPKAYVHMSCPDKDDFHTFIQVLKLDKDGNQLLHRTVPKSHAWVPTIAEIEPKDRTGLLLWHGSFGILKASHRNIDRSKSWHENVPFHPHDREEKVPPGEIVELEIGIWPLGVQFYAGEQLQVRLSGQDPRNPELQDAPFNPKRPESEKNLGKHQVHFGGKYESRIILPFLPVS